MKKLLLSLIIAVGFLTGCSKTIETPVQSEPIDVVSDTGDNANVGKSNVYFEPQSQPYFNGTYAENNKILWKYLSDTQMAINISGMNFITFYTLKPIGKDRSLLLAINGNTKGRVDLSKATAIDTGSDYSSYTFNMADMLINNYPYNLTERTDKEGYIVISAAVGEMSNGVHGIEFTE